MFRKRLVATAAAAPLLIFASGAFAETTITDTRTTGVSTATIGTGGTPDDIKITSAGKVQPTAGGTAVTIAGGVTVNSNNDVINEGEISFKNVDYVAGIKVLAGTTGDVTNKATIKAGEAPTATDTDKDGDDDGKFATGTGRYGILVDGGMTGNVVNDSAGAITIFGNDSYGIRVKGPLTGNLINRGSINVTGDNARGILLEAPVTGNVTVRGNINVLGEGAVGVAVDDITGQFLVQGAISSRGYRYNGRPGTKALRDQLDDDDKLQGGSAVVVAGNVTGGVLLDVATVAGNLDYDGDGIKNQFDTDDDNDGTLDATDTDDDNDGVLDADDKDADNDGVEDALEGTATLTTLGSAPALAIGSMTEAITIGKVAASGNDAYGLVVRGSITANGVLDNISATGIQIGTASGNTTTITGGIRLDGAISTIAYNNDSQALHLRSGAVAAEINLGGAILATTLATSAPGDDEDSYSAYGVRIDSGATSGVIKNSGPITVIAGGENGNAYGIQDKSGTVTSVTNTGSITAVITPTDDADDTNDADNDPTNEVIKGEAVAIDLRFAQAGVTIVQSSLSDGDDDGDPATTDPDADGDGIDDADEAYIVGDIRMGAFNDTLSLQNGKFTGDVFFGAGADTYNLSGGAEAIGRISDSDGQLTLDIGKAKLTITNATTIDATAINIAGTSSVIFTADPNAGTNTKLTVATANIANGAKLGLQLTDLIDEPERYVVIKTDTAGGLTVGTLDQSLTGNAPYLFVSTASADTTLGEVYIDVRRRTAAEMELNASESAALDAVYKALGLDDDIRDAFLNADDRKEFLDLYDQMLPDQGEGVFSSLDMVTRTVSRLTGTRPDLRQRYGPDSLWMQEINVQVMRDAGVTAGSETKAFGFVGGYESMGADGGALGATLAFVTAEEKDDVAKVGEETSVSLLEAGIYWRRSIGKFTINARGAAGYGWFTGDRVFIDPTTNVIKSASADWTGYTGVMSLGGSYEATMGRFYARPSLSLDYLYLSEDGRSESGESDGMNQTVDSRTSSRLSAVAELAIGATFGRDLWWRPEVRLGYRQHLAGEIGDTTFYFSADETTKSTLLATQPGDGSMIIGLSLKAGTAMSYVAVEGEYEVMDDEDRYNLQLAGRMMF